MAPLEFGIVVDSKSPTVIKPGWDIGGIISKKLFGSDMRLRIRLYCSKDDETSGVEAEVLKVWPRFKWGPFDIFEKRVAIHRIEEKLSKGEIKETTIELISKSMKVEMPFFVARHK